MPFINGPYITKEVVIPEHVEHQFDEDAYWHLDYWGTEWEDGTFLYAKVAYPTLKDAQRQRQLEIDAKEQEKAQAREEQRQRRKAAREARKAEQEARRNATET